MKSGIYAIGTPSGKIYIGSAVNLTRRRAEHWRALRKGAHVNTYLQNAFDKYGDALTWTVLLCCVRTELLEREQEFIDALPVELRMNLAMHAAGGTRELSAEARAKISAAQSGRKHTEDARARMSAAAILRMADPARRAKAAAAQSARALSSETRAKVGAARKGRKLTESTRANMVAAHARKAQERGAYPGACRTRNDTWNSRVSHNGKIRTLGTYPTAELAYTWRLVYLAALPLGGV